MKLNILFISSNYPPRIGGPATTVPQLAQKLSKNETVKVIAFREKGFPNHEIKDFELFRSPAFYYFGFNNPLSVLIRTVLLSAYARTIPYTKEANIIHSHDAHISAVAALFLKYTSIKKKIVFIKYAGDLVLEYSGLSENEGKTIEELLNNPTFKQKILFYIQKTIFNIADIIHVQNKYQSQILKTYYKIPENKIVIIPNPIESTAKIRKISKKNNSQTNILAVSRLVPWKGHETLIKAIQLLSKGKEKFKLTIVGSGSEDYTNKLHKLCKETNTEQIIHFEGKINRQDLKKYYSSADIFVQPSLYEPFGITVVEAITANLPIVATNVGGLPELITSGQNGYLSKAGDAKSLAQEINKARNLKINKSLNKNILYSFNTNKIVKEYKKAYLSALLKS